jgi:hypothetical protein
MRRRMRVERRVPTLLRRLAIAVAIPVASFGVAPSCGPQPPVVPRTLSLPDGTYEYDAAATRALLKKQVQQGRFPSDRLETLTERLEGVESYGWPWLLLLGSGRLEVWALERPPRLIMQGAATREPNELVVTYPAGSPTWGLGSARSEVGVRYPVADRQIHVVGGPVSPVAMVYTWSGPANTPPTPR